MIPIRPHEMDHMTYRNLIGSMVAHSRLLIQISDFNLLTHKIIQSNVTPCEFFLKLGLIQLVCIGEHTTSYYYVFFFFLDRIIRCFKRVYVYMKDVFKSYYTQTNLHMNQN